MWYSSKIDLMTEEIKTETKQVEKKSEKKTVRRLPKIIQAPIKFLLKILASAAKTIGSFLLIILLFYLLRGFLAPTGAGTFREIVITGEGPNKIIVVPLEGIILNSPAPFTSMSSNITPQTVRNVFKYAQEDKDIKGVILEIESPGGSAVASDRIYTIISNFKEETQKPVVALLGDTAASGGYYIAANADIIVANGSTLTGSIGVIATTFNIQELMGKLGIREQVFKKGEFKDILSATREITDEERQIIESILDDAYEQFLDRVIIGRKLSSEQLSAIANARIFSGLQAKEVGLVDTLGNLEEAISETLKLAKISQAQVVRIETGDIFDQLFSGISLGWLARIFSPVTSPRVWYLMQ